MPYKHDVFLSYCQGFIDGWLHDLFLPLFKFHLESAMGKQPDIFIDRDGISTGDSWPKRIQEALCHSKSLVAIWSPSYFCSDWCMYECMLMIKREVEHGYRTTKKPNGLVVPVNVSDGQSFPNFAQDIQYFDCREYVIDGQGFKQTQLYVELQQQIREWADDVAKTISQAPPWRRKWLDYKLDDIPKSQTPKMKLPTLE